MLTATEIELTLAAGYELRGFELKGAGPRGDNHLFAKVAKAALSMGNIRDGGHVVIGIHDVDPAAMLPGLNAAQRTSWLAYDDIGRKLAEYADPPLRFDVAGVELSSGAKVVCLQVFEFEDIPHLCRRGFEGVLREGGIYVRPRRIPETAEIATAIDMRDLLDLATEKALRRYIETAARAGAVISAGPDSPGDAQQYERELGGAW
jgi:predicted HTH transcriptional regulator